MTTTRSTHHPAYPPPPKRRYNKDGSPTAWLIRWFSRCQAIDAKHRASLLSTLRSRSRGKIKYSRSKPQADWTAKFHINKP